MKAIPEISDKAGVIILLETAHTCAFVRKGVLWFANDISDGGWFESTQSCAIAGIYQHELNEALKYDDARAKDFITCDPPDRCYIPGDSASTAVALVNPHGLEIKPHQEVMCMETSDGKQLAIRVCGSSRYRGHYHCVDADNRVYNMERLGDCIQRMLASRTGPVCVAWVSSWGSGMLEKICAQDILALSRAFPEHNFVTPAHPEFSRRYEQAMANVEADEMEGADE
jgi:hypothetical protein